jgi:hypothetical protein
VTLFYLILADLVLVLHALIVAFNIVALPVIWLGYFCRWRFVRNFTFRITHVALIAFITVESLLGAVCPFTTWENWCLTRAGVGPRYERDFIGYWVHRLLFYDCNEKVFMTAYVVFLLLVLATLVWVKPERRRKGKDGQTTPGINR